MRNDAALMRDLGPSAAAFPRPDPLADLGKVLLKSTSSINKASRNHFGLTPMQLLKQIRLQQVQHTLLNPWRRRCSGPGRSRALPATTASWHAITSPVITA